MKKKLLFIIIIVVIIIASFFIYFKYKNQKTDSDSILRLNFFPFGENNQDNNKPNNLVKNITDDLNNPREELYRVGDFEIAGFDVININNKYSVIFSDKKNGNIYSWSLENRELSRLSNSTILTPINTQVVTDKDQMVVIIKSVLAKNPLYSYIKMPIETIELKNKNTENIRPITLPPSYKLVKTSSSTAFSLEIFNDGVGIFSTKPGFTQKEQIFTSPFTDWVISPTSENTLFLTNKPSKQVSGFSYKIEPNNKLVSILKNLPGLIILPSPDGKKILYSFAVGQGIETRVYDLITKNTVKILKPTLVDKCDWMDDSQYIICAIPKKVPVASYPDDWYKGIVSFNDDIMAIDINNTLNVDLSLKTGGMDVGLIKEEDEGRLIIFQNKNDNSLWVNEFND